MKLRWTMFATKFVCSWVLMIVLLIQGKKQMRLLQRTSSYFQLFFSLFLIFFSFLFYFLEYWNFEYLNYKIIWCLLCFVYYCVRASFERGKLVVSLNLRDEIKTTRNLARISSVSISLCLIFFFFIFFFFIYIYFFNLQFTSLCNKTKELPPPLPAPTLWQIDNLALWHFPLPASFLFLSFPLIF